jgi:cyclopropane fatty-acyl-phospholipid synthase-like methyltransferase
MRAILGSLKRNPIALRRSKKETRRDYHARLLFEMYRRSNQLVTMVNPFDRDQYRQEKLVGPLGVWPQLQQYQFNALSSLGLQPHHSMIDIGCGPIAVGAALISYLDSGNYVGVDARSEPLVEAYRRIAKLSLTHKNPTLVLSSTFGKSELGDRRFDYVWVSQLSYHLTEAQMAQLFEHVCSMMHGTSVFLMDVIDPEIELEPQATWRGFSYHFRPFEFYETMAEKCSLSVQCRGTIRDYGYPDKINLNTNRLLAFRKRTSSLEQGQVRAA